MVDSHSLVIICPPYLWNYLGACYLCLCGHFFTSLTEKLVYVLNLYFSISQMICFCLHVHVDLRSYLLLSLYEIQDTLSKNTLENWSNFLRWRLNLMSRCWQVSKLIVFLVAKIWLHFLCLQRLWKRSKLIIASFWFRLCRSCNKSWSSAINCDRKILRDVYMTYTYNGINNKHLEKHVWDDVGEKIANCECISVYYSIRSQHKRKLQKCTVHQFNPMPCGQTSKCS